MKPRSLLWRSCHHRQTKMLSRMNVILSVLVLCIHDDFNRTTTTTITAFNFQYFQRRSSKSRSCPLSSVRLDGSSTTDKQAVNTSIQQQERAKLWIDQFSTALSSGDISTALDLFCPDSPPQCAGNGDDHDRQWNPPFWRDMIAYTWNIVTLEGRESIEKALQSILMVDDKESSPSTTPISTSWKLAEPSKSSSSSSSSFPPPILASNEDGGGGGGCEFWCDIETNVGIGRAHVRLNSNNQATTLLTVLLELVDRPFAVGPNRKRGFTHGPQFGRSYWSERRRLQLTAQPGPQQKQQVGKNDNNKEAEEEEETTSGEESYYVAIIGGGQAGLSLAARLEVLDIPYVVLEAGPTPGWSWRDNRYPSLHLHDPSWYQHLPYLPFPSSWPIFAPKDKLADWLDMYAKVMDIHIQTNTKVIHAEAITPEKSKQNDNHKDKSWKLDVVLNDGDDRTESSTIPSSSSTTTTSKATAAATRVERTIRAKHIVFATGNSSFRKLPKIPGTFHGIQIHSSNYKGGREFAGKRVVVIGSNNSGFDMVQDLWEQGAASVTMIQRTPSLVVSTESVLNHGLGPLYSEDARFHHDDADLIATTLPYKLLIQNRWPQVTETMKETDKVLIEGLERIGYKFDYGYQGTGLFAKSATEGGGFYINVGCAELLIRGDVHVRYATVERFEAGGIVIYDKDTNQQETLPADVIVYATGFATMDAWVERLCGSDVAQQVGRTWGLGLNHNPRKDPGPWEGELRNMWKPTNVDGLWFHGGNLAQCRHYSRFLALQLAARYLDLVDDTENVVYGIPKAVPPSD